MMGTRWTPPGVETATRRRSIRDQVGALLPILAGLVLWAWILAGVLTALAAPSRTSALPEAGAFLHAPGAGTSVALTAVPVYSRLRSGRRGGGSR